ncbi:hypothetical protein Cgig2_012113 [Carnegiea gigantea]|uniref:Endonuclease/exonuclease/phosphatase domain-containing protein n=1 Tax=Carnegiea gigantea TaxID=171969 RepID=A0A9Q1K0F7_9CARY|nr:hypothetical protein Cgig2_012113 [Carnegiea gigantea]
MARARTPSNLEVLVARPETPINGTVLQLTPPASTTQSEQNIAADFTPIQKRATANYPRGNTPTSAPLLNSFNALQMDKNIDKVAGKAFPGWYWHYNFELDLSTHKRFLIIFVYGMNQEQMRMPLWEDLQVLAQQITEAWCMLGDFNSVLYKEDRIGGIEIQDYEVQHLENFLDTCELQELRWTGMVFTNLLCHDTMDYTQTQYLPNGLSDHTPLMVKFPSSPKPRARFQFYDMWYKHRDFAHITASNLPPAAASSKMLQVRKYLDKIRPPLSKLNRQHFTDLRAQTEKARSVLSNLQLIMQQDPTNEDLLQKEQEARNRHLDMLSSSLSLIQQQSKIEWIKYGDDNTRLFHAEAKQRKMTTYIYSIQGVDGKCVEGFVKVQQLMLEFYKNLLGR